MSGYSNEGTPGSMFPTATALPMTCTLARFVFPLWVRVYAQGTPVSYIQFELAGYKYMIFKFSCRNLCPSSRHRCRYNARFNNRFGRSHHHIRHGGYRRRRPSSSISQHQMSRHRHRDASYDDDVLHHGFHHHGLRHHSRFVRLRHKNCRLFRSR